MKKKQKQKIDIPKDVKPIYKAYIDILNQYVLTPKQRLFILYYFKNGFNATQAARSAGYAISRAEQTGAENVRKSKVAACIKAIKAITENKLAQEAEISIERTAKELAKIGYANPVDVFDIKSSKDITPEQEPLIHNIRFVNKDGKISIKEFSTLAASDKTQALDKLMRHLGGFEKDNKQKGEVTVEARNAVVEELLRDIAAKQTTLPGEELDK